MKAMIYTSYGPSSVLRLAELAVPTPQENEILVQVYATTVNRTDCAMLRAKPFIMRFFTGLFRPKNPVLGTEFSGKVVAVGNGVTTFKIGDSVFGFDDQGVSAYAEYLAIDADKAVATIPENTSYEQAAASLEGAHYAYNFINKVRIESGQNILVNGATGGIGSAMVQLLCYMGANVTAVANTKNIALVKSLGASRVIDYTQVDFTKDQQTFDFIFDAVGKSSFRKCSHLLNPRGVYISSELGWMAQNTFYALFTPIFGGRKVIFPIPVNIKASLNLVKKNITEGKFKAVIDRQYLLNQVAEAFDYVETGQKTGSVVILVSF